MRKIIPLLVLSVLSFTACRYEESVPSLQKPETRLIGTWSLQKSYKNGAEQKDTDFNSHYMNRPGSYYFFYFDGSLAIEAYASGFPQQSSKGFWIFSDNKKKLEMNFVFWNQRHSYSAEIIKLSKQELKYRYKDENGDEWQLEMFKRS